MSSTRLLIFDSWLIPFYAIHSSFLSSYNSENAKKSYKDCTNIVVFDSYNFTPRCYLISKVERLRVGTCVRNNSWNGSWLSE